MSVAPYGKDASGEPKGTLEAKGDEVEEARGFHKMKVQRIGVCEMRQVYGGIAISDNGAIRIQSMGDRVQEEYMGPRKLWLPGIIGSLTS